MNSAKAINMIIGTKSRARQIIIFIMPAKVVGAPAARVKEGNIEEKTDKIMFNIDD